MGNSSEVEISRNEEVSMADSTVELYLDKTVLDLTIEEYETLKGTLLDWADQIGANIEKVQDASSGEASYAIAKQGGAYLDEDFTELLTKTDVALNTMNLTSFIAHRLLLRCENFYEILQGESEYMGDSLDTAGMAGLIKHFEEDGICFNGNIGTSPVALYDYFVDNGYTAEYTLSTRDYDADAIGDIYDTIVVTAYNNEDDITDQIHTVCITKDISGNFVIHNTGLVTQNGKYVSSNGINTGKDAYSSLSQAIADISHDENSASIMIIGVTK